MGGPLEGIRIVDWTQWQQGPAATALLADLGAEVIKIEDRVTGDAGRGIATIMGLMVGKATEWNFYIENFNRGKRGITLDLRKGKGREVVYRLVEKSDVFIHNYRQGVPEKLGLDYQTLKRYNPKVIYGVVSAFGPQGPDAAKTGMDYTFQARSGFMASTGEPGMPPQLGPIGIADQMGATCLALGILAALLARERLGVSQKVDASGLGGMIWLQQLTIGAMLGLNEGLPRVSRKTQGNPLWNYYRCQDEKWLMLAMLQSDRYWPDLCRVLERADLVADERCGDAFKRSENREWVIQCLDEVFATRPREEWMRLLKEGGDFIFGPVNTPLDLLTDPQVVANRYIIEFDHPSYGPIKEVGFPIQLSGTPAEVRRPAPEFGQHTEEVLLELGYTWEEIGRLRQEEVI